jgi:hypothetical protein
LAEFLAPFVPFRGYSYFLRSLHSFAAIPVSALILATLG